MFFTGCSNITNDNGDENILGTSSYIETPPLWNTSFEQNSPHVGPDLTHEIDWDIKTFALGSGISVDGFGNLHISKAGGGYFIYSRDREEVYSAKTWEHFTQPYIANNGTIYVGSINGSLLRIKQTQKGFVKSENYPVAYHFQSGVSMGTTDVSSNA